MNRASKVVMIDVRAPAFAMAILRWADGGRVDERRPWHTRFVFRCASTRRLRSGTEEFPDLRGRSNRAHRRRIGRTPRFCPRPHLPRGWVDDDGRAARRETG